MGRSAIAVALVLLALAGCGSDAESGPEGPVATYVREDGDDGGDAAALAGTLELRDGCLWVVDDSSTPAVVGLPAFAGESVTWDADAAELDAEGVVVKVGSRVELTGGTSGASMAQLPEACSDEGSVFYVAPSGVEAVGGAG